MNWKSATTASAGLASGKITLVKIAHSFAPSSLAASDSSCGIVMKNCRSRKIKYTSPKKDGTISGLYEFNQPRFLKVMNRGTNRTWNGIMIVVRHRKKIKLRPRQRRRENP